MMRIDRRPYAHLAIELALCAALAATLSLFPARQIDLTIPQKDHLLIGPVSIPALKLEHAWIEVSQGAIRAVSTSRLSETMDPPSKEIGEGLVATPGLTDRHVHYPPSFVPEVVDLFNVLFLRYGVTSVREMGTLGADTVGLAREIEQGDRIGPRITTCGRPLTGGAQPWWLPFSIRVNDATEAREAVRDQARAGASCIKIFRDFPVALLGAVTDEASQLGLPVVGHLPSDAPWDERRISDIQHVCDPRCAGLRDSSIKKLTESAVRNGLAHTPTLVAFSSRPNRPADADRLLPDLWYDELWTPGVLRFLGFQGLFDTRSRRRVAKRVTHAVEALVQSHVQINIGTDTGFPGVLPGSSLVDEIHALNDAGLTPERIWTSVARPIPRSTMTPATAIDPFQPGSAADILLFRKDPTKSLDNLDSLEFVIADGRLYSTGDLSKLAETLRENSNSSWIGFAIRHAIQAARWTVRPLDSTDP